MSSGTGATRQSDSRICGCRRGSRASRRREPGAALLAGVAGAAGAGARTRAAGRRRTRALQGSARPRTRIDCAVQLDVGVCGHRSLPLIRPVAGRDPRSPDASPPSNRPKTSPPARCRLDRAQAGEQCRDRGGDHPSRPAPIRPRKGPGAQRRQPASRARASPLSRRRKRRGRPDTARRRRTAPAAPRLGGSMTPKRLVSTCPDREHDDPGDDQQMQVAVAVGGRQHRIVVLAQPLLGRRRVAVEVRPPHPDRDQQRRASRRRSSCGAELRWPEPRRARSRRSTRRGR